MDAKEYNLEKRTYDFAMSCRTVLKTQVWPPVAWADVQQLLRSSGSVAANFVEASEGISKDDSLYRMRLCKKEAKESGLWLRLLSDCNDLPPDIIARVRLLQIESAELVRIFAAIIKKRLATSK